jgi:hypothetical protein
MALKPLTPEELATEEARIQAYEDQGMTRSDAQGRVEAEDRFPEDKTTAPAHTPGPWKALNWMVYDGNDKPICECKGKVVGAGLSAPDHNANRIVACVNACEGLNPEAVKEMYEMLRVLNERLDDPEIDALLAKAEGRS